MFNYANLESRLLAEGRFHHFLQKLIDRSFLIRFFFSILGQSKGWRLPDLSGGNGRTGERDAKAVPERHQGPNDAAGGHVRRQQDGEEALLEQQTLPK